MSEELTYDEFPIPVVLGGPQSGTAEQQGADEVPVIYGIARGSCVGALRKTLLAGCVSVACLTVNGEEVQHLSLGGTTYIASIAEVSQGKKGNPQTVPMISEQIEAVMRAFSLTVTQAARVLNITRPTVYAWKKTEDPCNAEDPKHQRLMKVHDLVKQWLAHDLGPMGDRNLVPFEDDRKSIVGYLSSPDLDDQLIAKIHERLDILANPKAYPGLLAIKGTNWREAFRRQGIAGPTPEQQDAIQDDNLSRIRHEN